MEASIEDTVIVLFNALGFNDGDLITVYVLCFFLFDFIIEFSSRSRNRLNFQMSNKMVCADADLTVFNLKTWIRLALVEVCFILSFDHYWFSMITIGQKIRYNIGHR
jgi:hypothetical protein